VACSSEDLEEFFFDELTLLLVLSFFEVLIDYALKFNNLLKAPMVLMFSVENLEGTIGDLMKRFILLSLWIVFWSSFLHGLKVIAVEAVAGD